MFFVGSADGRRVEVVYAPACVVRVAVGGEKKW
jgi:hypothetical protein